MPAASSTDYFCTAHPIDGSYTDAQRKLQPAPSSQQAETTTSCLQRKSHLPGEGRGRVALNIIWSPVELFADFIFFLMPEGSLEMSLLVILLNRCPATCRKMKLPMAFAKS